MFVGLQASAADRFLPLVYRPDSFNIKVEVDMERLAMALYTCRASRWMLFVAAYMAFSGPGIAFAQNESSIERSQNFFSSIPSLLNVASVVVLAITLLFVFYQLVFKRKNFKEVGAVLVGGLLVSVAAQIARLLLPDDVVSATAMMSQTFLLIG